MKEQNCFARHLAAVFQPHDIQAYIDRYLEAGIKRLHVARGQ